ncbi:MAG: hypothetical protein JXQ30_08260 [Spirochaetes bacterium]|nr:hypothetical protein [Spirochaetota bacterium]
MNVKQLAVHIGARIYSGPGKSRDIKSVYAGDRISELLSAASDDTLLVTNLIHPQLFRIAQLMEVPGICLLNGVSVEKQMVDLAVQNGTCVLVSYEGMYETCGRIWGCLLKEESS